MGQKYTPGPWKVDSYGVVTGGLTTVAEAPIIKWATSQALAGQKQNWEAADWCKECFDEAVANARLIAAAPELLEALRNLLHSPGLNQDDLRDTEEAIEAARAVLAKAEGP